MAQYELVRLRKPTHKGHAAPDTVITHVRMPPRQLNRVPACADSNGKCTWRPEASAASVVPLLSTNARMCAVHPMPRSTAAAAVPSGAPAASTQTPRTPAEFGPPANAKLANASATAATTTAGQLTEARALTGGGVATGGHPELEPRDPFTNDLLRQAVKA